MPNWLRHAEMSGITATYVLEGDDLPTTPSNPLCMLPPMVLRGVQAQRLLLLQ